MKEIRYPIQNGLIILLVLFSSCSDNRITKEEKLRATSHKTLAELEPVYDDGDINVIIEIPAGTLEKWEMDKDDEEIKLQLIDDKPRIINYLCYPANYGMIPGTLLPEGMGGDGDPLDAIVLGPAIDRGRVAKCKILGILYLTDDGEQDDKLITVQEGTDFYSLNDINELNLKYFGISEILQIWFTNYKGGGIISSTGFGDAQSANKVLNLAIEQYHFIHNKQ